MRWLTGFLDVTAEQENPATAFWAAVSGSRRSPLRGEHEEFSTLLPPDGDPFLRLQRVLAGPGGCHLDLHVDDLRAEADRAVRLGAALVTAEADVIVLRSPAGLLFCLVPAGTETRRPKPIRWPDGHRSLVDQVCLDIPRSRFDRECAFWPELTGWELRASNRAEFRSLRRPPELPIRLLLQRLDTEPVSGAAAHLDLACDDADAESLRHQGLGATVRYRTEDWITLRDPAGRDYCITRRSPDTGVPR